MLTKNLQFSASGYVTFSVPATGLYDVLVRLQPTPVVALNRAVAIAMRDGPGAGLPLIEALLADGQLQDYHLAHAARDRPSVEPLRKRWHAHRIAPV